MAKIHGGYKNIAEGKTKVILVDPNDRNYILVKSKDAITAGDGAKKDILQKKGIYSTSTTCNIFEFLRSCGITTHFKERVEEDIFRAVKCDMIPLEVVARRLAAGSYIRRNPAVPEGYRFATPLIELFLKDDSRHDPLMTSFEILKEKVTSKEGHPITQVHIDWMVSICQLVFLLLERAWNERRVALVDLKVEFGFDPDGECILADVIDNDSWRIWPGGDKSLMKDKQVYRNLTEISQNALNNISKNYEWVAENTSYFTQRSDLLSVILMGSQADQAHALEIQRILEQYGVPVQCGILSAHKTPESLLARIHEIEGAGKRVVYIAVAGRSNGLGPVIDGSTAFPVINCPPYSDKFGGMDILSSLRLPSGLGAVTVIEPETAALACVKILANDDAVLWGRLKVNAWKRTQHLLKEDRKLLSRRFLEQFESNSKKETGKVKDGGSV